MAKKLVLKDEHIRDGFNVNFPGVDFSHHSEANEEIYNDEQKRALYIEGREDMRRAQVAFKDLIQANNSMSGKNLVALAFCREMANTHRTLQQSFVSQLLVGIHAYAKWAKENNLYDDRNRGFIQMADDLEKLLDEHGLPFI